MSASEASEEKEFSDSPKELLPPNLSRLSCVRCLKAPAQDEEANLETLYSWLEGGYQNRRCHRCNAAHHACVALRAPPLRFACAANAILGSNAVSCFRCKGLGQT